MGFPRGLHAFHTTRTVGRRARAAALALSIPQHQEHLTDPPVAFVGPGRKLLEARNADNKFLIERKPIVWTSF